MRASLAAALALVIAFLLAAPALAGTGGASFSASTGDARPARSTASGGATPVAKTPVRRRRRRRVHPKQRVHVRAQPKVGAKPKPKPKPKVRAKPKPRPKPPVRSSGIFPVAGPHSFGGAANRFGAPRSGHIHQGQDILAPVGTPVVAPRSGTVIWRANQPGGAGLYVIVHGRDGRDYAFMHLRPGSIRVVKGDAVSAGERLAQIGLTGDSTGAHLHFEIWVGGWYARGGHPIDPLPDLRRWDR